MPPPDDTSALTPTPFAPQGGVVYGCDHSSNGPSRLRILLWDDSRVEAVVEHGLARTYPLNTHLSAEDIAHLWHIADDSLYTEQADDAPRQRRAVTLEGSSPRARGNEIRGYPSYGVIVDDVFFGGIDIGITGWSGATTADTTVATAWSVLPSTVIQGSRITTPSGESYVLCSDGWVPEDQGEVGPRQEGPTVWDHLLEDD